MMIQRKRRTSSLGRAVAPRWIRLAGLGCVALCGSCGTDDAPTAPPMSVDTVSIGVMLPQNMRVPIDGESNRVVAEIALEDVNRTAALGAFQHVDREHSPHQLGPLYWMLKLRAFAAPRLAEASVAGSWPQPVVVRSGGLRCLTHSCTCTALKERP